MSSPGKEKSFWVLQDEGRFWFKIKEIEDEIKIICITNNKCYIDSTYSKEYQKKYLYVEHFNDIISLFVNKKILLKKSKNDEIDLKFKQIMNFKKTDIFNLNKTPNEKTIKKNDLEYRVYELNNKVYIQVTKNNKIITFEFGNDAKVDDVASLIKEDELKFIDINNSQNLQLNRTTTIALTSTNNKKDAENYILEYYLNKFEEMNNEISDKKENNIIDRTEQKIKEIKDKQKDMSSDLNKILENIEVMKNNANEMIFPKERTPLNVNEIQDFNSYIIGRTNDFNLIDNQLKKIYKKGVKYELIYRASRDRDLAKIFKEKCKNIRGTLIVVKTENKHIFGGFTKCIWDDSERNYDDEKAFCFSLNQNKIYGLREYCSAIGCDKGSGPRFCWMFEIYNKFMIHGGKVYPEDISHYSGQKKDYELTDGEEYFIVYELEVFKISEKN